MTLDLAALEQLEKSRQAIAVFATDSDSMGDALRLSCAEHDIQEAVLPVFGELLALAREAETLRGRHSCAEGHPRITHDGADAEECPACLLRDAGDVQLDEQVARLLAIDKRREQAEAERDALRAELAANIGGER